MVENGLSLSRWRRLARGTRGALAGDGSDCCELCAAPLEAEHRHLLDVPSGELRCACAACALLFDRREAGGGHYRAVPRRCVELDDFALDDLTWAALDVPVKLAFFVTDDAGRVTATYPNPLGVVRSSPDPATWREVCDANPILAGLEPAVEALLVFRSRDVPRYWLAPVDVCYRLASVVRAYWEGFTGGTAVWRELEEFLDGLAPPARRRKEVQCHPS